MRDRIRFRRPEVDFPCPHCGKELSMEPRVENNVTTYRQSVIGATKCCNKLVVVSPRSGISVSKYVGDRKEDDWGVEVP